MKKIFSLSICLLMTATLLAQHRGRIENLNTEVSIPRTVGTPGMPLRNTGAPVIPVLLVEFADKTFSVEATAQAVRESYDKFCNGNNDPVNPYRESYAWGSVRDYYISMSDSAFQPVFDVMGPIKLDKPYAYYGKNGASKRDVNFDECVSEALAKAVKEHGYDTSKYDSNGKGITDFLFVIYAGEGESAPAPYKDENTIWPKEKSRAQDFLVDGVTYTVGGYGATCELYKNKHDGVGTLCHELTHALGLPDFYDTNYVAYGMDYWDLMDSGCYQINAKCPCAFTAYERDFMGWRTLVEVTSADRLTLVLDPMEAGGKGYKLVHDGYPNEYFVLENRQNTGFDTYLGCPDASMYKTYGANHGLMITHVDYNEQAWRLPNVNDDAAHQRMTIVPADGSLYSYMDAVTPEEEDAWAISQRGDLYPGNGGVTEMSDYGTYNGTGSIAGVLGQTVTNIREEYDEEKGWNVIRVDINGGGESGIERVATTASITGVYYDLQGRRVSTPSRGIYINNGRKVYVK